MRIRYSTEAHNDLVDIIAYGNENFGSVQSGKNIAQIRNAIELIGLNLEMARLWTELERPVRIHTVGSHMVVFNIEEGTIVTVRILSAGQNLLDNV